MFENEIDDCTFEQQQKQQQIKQDQQQQEEDNNNNNNNSENDLLNNIINGLVFDINKLEKEISILQEISTTPPTPTTPRSSSNNNNNNSNEQQSSQPQQQQQQQQQPHNYKEELDNVTNLILQEFELSKISSLGNSSNNNSNNRKINAGDNNPDKLLEIQLINKIFDINKAFDNNSNNLMSSFQSCATNEQLQQQQSQQIQQIQTQQTQSPPIIGRSINSNNNNNISNNSNSNSNGNNNNVTIGSLRDLNKIQPQNLNEFGEWKSLIDEELSDLYTLVKELKRKIPSASRTNSSNNLNASPVSKSKNKDLYLYNNTFTNILQLKNDLVSMIQSPMLNKDKEFENKQSGGGEASTSTLIREDSSNSINSNNNNNNNNNSPNKKSVKQLVLLFSP